MNIFFYKLSNNVTIWAPSHSIWIIRSTSAFRRDIFIWAHNMNVFSTLYQSRTNGFLLSDVLTALLLRLRWKRFHFGPNDNILHMLLDVLQSWIICNSCKVVICSLQFILQQCLLYKLYFWLRCIKSRLKLYDQNVLTELPSNSVSINIGFWFVPISLKFERFRYSSTAMIIFIVYKFVSCIALNFTFIVYLLKILRTMYLWYI